MGLKNRLSKMKSFLFDEEEEKEEKVPVKKSKKEKEVFKPKKVEEIEEIEELYINDIEDEPVAEELKSRTTKVEKEFSFPDFDDDDFMVAEKKPEPIIKSEKEEPKPIPLYQGSKRKEESKRFKPSPIISPIYGLLDEEGNTVKEDKNDSSYNDDISLDDVRKKAYGTINLEDTLKKLSSKTIEEAEEEMEKEELSRSKNKVVEEVSSISKADIEVDEDDDDDNDMILPNVNFKEIDVDKESKSSKKEKNKREEPVVEQSSDEDDEDDETKEQDLFNLIDTMYQENGDED